MNEQDTAVREFLAESYENLDQLERDLVTIEANARDRDTLGRIFRTIHSIKGACGFLAYPKLEAVAHAGESLLCLLRDDEIPWRPAITSGLLALSDAMRKLLATIETEGSEGSEEYSALIAQLVALQAGEQPGTEATESPLVEQDGESTSACVDGREDASRGAEALREREDKAGFHDDAAGAGASGISSGNVRVDVGLLDRLMNLVGELVLARNQILQYANVRENTSLVGASQRLNLITTELQEGVMKTRMQPIGKVWNKFPRVVRDLAIACGKLVKLELDGSETELDRTIIEAIKDPLTHLVRNAIDHGIEEPMERQRRGKPTSGCLRLRAFHESGQVNIEISDDGGGIDVERVTQRALERGLLSREQVARMTDHDLMQLIFLPGFSTAERISNISGRGVGMDVVKTNIEKIGGTIDVHSSPGEGTSLRIRIPLTLAIIPALIVTASDERFAIPQVNLLELVRLERHQVQESIQSIHGAPIFRLRGSLVPLVDLNRMLGLQTEDSALEQWRSNDHEEELDFAKIREAHVRWRMRLERMLRGEETISANDTLAPDQSEFGRWLYGPLKSKFGHRIEFISLEKIHAEFHSICRSVVEYYHAGYYARAEDRLREAINHSHELQLALTKLEMHVEASYLVNIVVLQADGRRFGLVVDGISDTEEIVVKPLGKQLKGLALYAGATIMGDGRVCLILDVAGISRRAGVVSGQEQRLALEKTEAADGKKVDRSAYLLLRNGDDGRVAIPLSLVARLEEIPCSSVEHSGGREVVQYRNQIIPLVRLSEALSYDHRSLAELRDPMQVVVYSQRGQGVGLVVDGILDIVEDTIQVRHGRGRGSLIGSAVIQQRVTDVIDVPELIRNIDPELMASVESGS
jgi:chemotaxis protein histidine kinase CheA